MKFAPLLGCNVSDSRFSLQEFIVESKHVGNAVVSILTVQTRRMTILGAFHVSVMLFDLHRMTV